MSYNLDYNLKNHCHKQCKNPCCRCGNNLQCKPIHCNPCYHTPILPKPQNNIIHNPCYHKPICTKPQNNIIYKHCHHKPYCPKPCNSCEKILVNYIFKDHTIEEIRADFNSNVFADYGSMTIDNEGLLISTNPFPPEATTPIGNEHPKNLRYWNDSFELSDEYELYYESEVAVEQYFDISRIPPEFLSRIRNINEDIRLCAGAINTLDPITWSVLDIFLSNEKIYCFVERLPFGQSPSNRYAAYSNAVAIIDRGGDPYNDFVKVAFGLQPTGANFYINDKLVYSVPILGVRLLDEYRMLEHQGDSSQIRVNSSFLGFGLFSLLDMQLPYNYARQLVVNDMTTNQSASGLVQLDNADTYGEILPGKFEGSGRPIIDPSVTWAVTLNEFPNNNQDKKIFGQGAAIRLRYFKVSQRYYPETTCNNVI